MPDETTGAAKKILILSANPRDTARLRLDKEVREIQDRLKRAKYGNRFTVQLATAIRIRDLQQELLEHEPDIVHFCGHGEEEGILVEDEQGKAVLIPSEALASLFSLCSEHVECVLLNSCHSRAQAEAACQYIPYVIGMKKAVDDEAAVEFAAGFYTALGFGKSIEDAFDFGKTSVQLYDLPDHLTPILLKQKVVADTPEKSISPKVDNTTSSDRPSVSAPVAAKQNLPQRLITARQENKLIPIVGAGVSMSLKDESGECLFPGWDQLLEYAADALKMEGKEDLSEGIRIMLKLKKLQEAADLANDGLTGRLWTEFFEKYIEEPLDRAPDDSFALPKAVWRISNRVITLNYDKVLRIACPNIRRLKELDNSNQAGLADFKTNNDTPMVWHLHGRTDNISTLIFTAESYSRLYAETDKNYQAALDLFKDLCRDNHLLFVGCSLEDAELLQAMAGQHKLFGENTGPHYALVREKHKAEISRKLDGMPLELLTFEDFGEPLLELVQAIAGPKTADASPPETKEPEVIPEETTAPEENKEEPHPKDKRMALLSASPLDDEQEWKSYVDELGKLACPIDHFSLSIDNLNNLEGYDYVLIISKVVKNKLLIESEYLCSDKISFQDLEDSIGIGQPDGIFIFVDQLPEPESTAELSLPTFILPVENKKHVHKILFQLFRKNNLECCDKSRLLHPAAFHLCPLNGKKGIHREETELSKSISPKALKGFVGRKDDLENICRKLMELEQGEVLTVKGAGGIGKTHTVKKIAAALADRGLFSGGIHFIDCEPVTDSKQFQFKAAAVFGLELAEDLWQHLSEHHDDQDRLIIFDNFEPLLYLDDQEKIKDILSKIADYATVLVTSREVLDLEGETVHQMRRLTTDEAVELFKAKFPVPDKQIELLRQKILSRLLDNNSLAIKLITDTLPKGKQLDVLREELEEDLFAKLSVDELEIFDSGPDSNIERMDSIYASILYSYRLLTEREKTVFELLSLFPDGIHLEEFKKLTAKDKKQKKMPPLLITERMVIALEKKSMIENNGGQLKHQSMIGRFAQAMLKQREDIAPLYRNAFAYNRRLANALYQNKTTSELSSRSLEIFSSQQGNFLSAVRYCDRFESNKEEMLDYFFDLLNLFINICSLEGFSHELSPKIDLFQNQEKQCAEAILFGAEYYNGNFFRTFAALQELLPLDRINGLDRSIFSEQLLGSLASDIYEMEGEALWAARDVAKQNFPYISH